MSEEPIAGRGRRLMGACRDRKKKRNPDQKDSRFFIEGEEVISNFRRCRERKEEKRVSQSVMGFYEMGQ